jgi:hypothetical protein
MALKVEFLPFAIIFLAMRVASAEPVPTPEAAPPTIKVGGYLEVYDQWNFRRPSNGVTNLRAYDVRDSSIALQNAVLDATWTRGAISGRIAFQIGDAGDTYYAAEPAMPAEGSTPATGPNEWRHLQEAWAAWQTPCKLELAAGLFLSPIGPEALATKDDWNWSRSNLYFALPFYLTGVRVKRALGESGWIGTAAVYNGWNSVIDNNRKPSISVAASYAKDALIAQVLYFGGIERSPGAPEGEPWRHLLDAYVQGSLGGGLSFLVHADGGLERGTLGTSSWAAGAAYLRYDVTTSVYLAARADYVREWRDAAASSMLLPVAWVGATTATAAWRPRDGLDLRLEYRHDQAASEAYFGGTVSSDLASGAAIPNRLAQDTVTAGAIAWF